MPESTLSTPPAAAPRSALLGAMFLMATSAIGPGFLTQTSTFTAQLGAAFACAILVSILLDIAVQMNVWRVIGVTGLQAQTLGNLVLPGLGWFLAGTVALGGMVFNIGNVAGGGLGLDAMLGLDPKWGAIVTAAIAIGVFLSKRAGVALDRIVVVLGAAMILVTAYVAVSSKPPVGRALTQAVLPDTFSVVAVTTLIGGTVGGYICYAGAHRLIDSGISGPERVGEISRTSVIGILVTGVMRVLLFLAVLGVVSTGVTLDAGNPAASAFEHAVGEVGLRAFGFVMWAAAITSVIGASYTSVSFLLSKGSAYERFRPHLTVGFIAVATGVFLWLGAAPAKLLIFAGAFNGIALPIGFTVLLWIIWRRRDLLRGYAYPRWLAVVALVGWVVLLYLGYKSLLGLGNLWT